MRGASRNRSTIIYEDFDLHLSADGDRFVVSGCRGAQCAREPFALDLSHNWDLSDLVADAPLELRRRGAALFDALIPGRIRELYQQAKGAIGSDPARGLRIRVSVDPRDARMHPLMRVPWEILIDVSADRDEHLTLDGRQVIVRSIDCIEPALAAVEGQLASVLLALANPSETEPLDLDRERAAVEEALIRIAIRPSVLRHATRDGLLEHIRDEAPHIVHFMGHGWLDDSMREAVLLLEGKHGETDPIAASTFASFFTGRASPRLVILTACLSSTQGRAAAFGPFASMAGALIAAGLPAVVAMQSEISDPGAIRFTERLYRRLVAGDPIETAVSEARLALRAKPSESAEWAIPVLFLRGRGATTTVDTAPGPVSPPPSNPFTIVNARDIGVLVTGSNPKLTFGRNEEG